MLNALQDIEAFKGASQETLEILTRIGQVKTYAKGEHIFYDKEMVTTMYVVLDGMVTLYKINVQGEKKIMFVYGKGNIINEVVLQGMASSISCEVFENAKIFAIDKEELLKLMEKDFGLTMGILRSISLKTRRLYRQLKNTSNSVRGDKRIAAKLWKLSGDYGIPCDKGVLIDLDLSITYLADMLGSQRETISRQIKMLIKEGLIIKNKSKIIVTDREKLANYFKSL